MSNPDFGAITQFMFRLSLMDTKSLRGKYRMANEDLPHGLVMTAKPKHIIEHLAQLTFGVDAMHAYHKQCIEWDTTETIMKGKKK